MPIPPDPVVLLKDLIAVPSVNPDGDPGVPEDQCGEQKIAEFVGELLAEWGAEVVFDEVAPGRPNVLGRFPTDAPSKPPILFAPHLDTVGVGNMCMPPFDPVEKDGRIYGRGASDTKGPMAAMLCAIARLGEEVASLPCEIHFVGFASEESRQLGSRHFAAHRATDYAFAIVGEPTRMAVVHTHKGCTWCTIEVPGVSGHGSMPEVGSNAITRAVRIIDHLDTTFRNRLKTLVPDDPILGHSTINIGCIDGGTRANIVPHRCLVTVDMRATPALLAADRTPTELLAEAVAEIDSEAVVTNLTDPTSPLLTDPADPYASQLAQAGNGFDGAPWFCDAAHLAAVGLPSVAIGPGSIDQAHTADEWISIDELEDGMRRFENFLRSL